MRMFGTRGRTALVAAADAVDVVDPLVAHLYSLLERSAGVLSEVEYAEIVREFETVISPVRALRMEFDDLVDRQSRDDLAFGRVADALRAQVPALQTASESLQEYADAQALCLRTSGELLNEIARIEGGQRGDDASWRELAAWGRSQVDAAAEQAAVRNWLAAHRMLLAARRTIDEAGGQVQDREAELNRKKSRVSELAAMSTLLRSKGAEAADAFERLTQASPADAAPHRAAIVQAGADLREVNEAVSLWNRDPGSSPHDLDDLAERAERSLAALDRFLGYAGEVLAP